MANPFLRSLRRACISSFLQLISSKPMSTSNRSSLNHRLFIFATPQPLLPLNPWWVTRNFSHGSVNFVIAEGKPKFEIHEIDPPKKHKFLTKKRLKLKRKREKEKRKAANRRDPRCIRVKGKKKKQRFGNAEERIKYKLEKAKIKEALLIERLKRYEVPKVQGPTLKKDDLTGEEGFYMKKMGQRGSNYVPVGRRGIFGGVILNMHMHWKKHETVKVICKPCKPGQVRKYADEIARLSGGTPIQIIGDDTIIFYRGKNYVQPKVMSPVDTLSKKRALEKSKYEQSLESVRHFIAILEKELELYYRHLALYGDLNDRNPMSIFEGHEQKYFEQPQKKLEPDMESDRLELELSEIEDETESNDFSDLESDQEDLSCSSEDDDREESESSEHARESTKVD